MAYSVNFVDVGRAHTEAVIYIKDSWEIMAETGNYRVLALGVRG